MLIDIDTKAQRYDKTSSKINKARNKIKEMKLINEEIIMIKDK